MDLLKATGIHRSTFYYYLKKLNKTVLKLMKKCSIKCPVRLRRYHSYKGEVGKAAPNLLQGLSRSIPVQSHEVA